jgi:centromeric protein E
VANNLYELDEASGDLKKESAFSFMGIYDSTFSNEDVFNDIALKLIRQCISGFNGTLFAYGQTASGKTHTMMGDDKEPGLMILAADEIFEGVASKPDTIFLIRLSYIEIYNEEIKDLLDPDGEKLKIYDHPMQGPYVKGVTEKVVRSVEEVCKIRVIESVIIHLLCFLIIYPVTGSSWRPSLRER